MKKMKSIILIIVILTAFFASCSSKEYRSEPKASPTSTPQKVHSILKDEATSEESTTTDEDFPSEDEIASAKAAFEKLREAVIEANPHREKIWKKIYNYLANISQDRIMIAMAINPLDSIKLEDGSSPLYCYIAYNEYGFFMGDLMQSTTRLQPIRIDLDDDGEVVNILIPHIAPFFDTREEIAAVFGLNEDEFPFTFDLEDKRDVLAKYSKNLNSLMYDIALSGGFDGFNNETVEILKSLYEMDITDGSREAPIRQELIAQNFLYGSIIIPLWYEIGADESTINSAMTVYQCDLKIYQGGNSTLVSEQDYKLNQLISTLTGDGMFVTDMSEHIALFQSEDELFEKLLIGKKGYYTEFIDSDDYTSFQAFCDSVMDSIINGTFDYANDSLNYKN